MPEAAVADLRRQMAGLLHKGFVAATGRRRLPDVVRYLKAMAHRLEKLPANAARDALGASVTMRRTLVAPPGSDCGITLARMLDFSSVYKIKLRREATR